MKRAVDEMLPRVQVSSVKLTHCHCQWIYKYVQSTEADLDAPYFKDLWGYKVAWRLEEDGWNDHMRKQMLNLGRGRNKMCDVQCQLNTVTLVKSKKLH